MQDSGTIGIISYTVRAQRVFGYAQQEATERGQRYLGPEHLLLGLLREPDNLGCQMLKRLNVPLMDLRERTEARMVRPIRNETIADEPANQQTKNEPVEQALEVRLTPRAHRVLALAYDEARMLRHNSVGTEHLMLALVREAEGLPARLLKRSGVDLAGARAAVAEMVGGKPVDFNARPFALPPLQSTTVQGLLAALKHDGRSGRPVLGMEWMAAYLFACLAFLMVLVHAEPWEDELSFVAYMTFCIVVLRRVYLFINKMIASPQQRQAAQRLAQLHDKRVIGHLVDFCTWPDESVRQAAKRALVQMLPTMQPADAGLFTPMQQSVLRSFLQRRYADTETGLQIAILKAYEQIGDERSLPAVRTLANLNTRTKARQRVRDAAETCLPFLEQRRERQHSSQTLLRPTTANVEPAKEILLRPATQQVGTNPEELLRAGLSDETTGA